MCFVFFFLVVSFFQGKRKRKPPSAKSCLCVRRAALGRRVHCPRRLESTRRLPAPPQPSSQEGVRTNPSLAKVLWLIQNVRDGRERRAEGEPDPQEGWRRRRRGGGGGTGRTTRAAFLLRRSARQRRARNGSRQPGHGDQRLRSAATRCGFGPRRGTSLLRAS